MFNRDGAMYLCNNNTRPLHGVIVILAVCMPRCAHLYDSFTCNPTTNHSAGNYCNKKSRSLACVCVAGHPAHTSTFVDGLSLYRSAGAHWLQQKPIAGRARHSMCGRTNIRSLLTVASCTRLAAPSTATAPALRLSQTTPALRTSQSTNLLFGLSLPSSS